MNRLQEQKLRKLIRLEVQKLLKEDHIDEDAVKMIDFGIKKVAEGLDRLNRVNPNTSSQGALQTIEDHLLSVIDGWHYFKESYLFVNADN